MSTLGLDLEQGPDSRIDDLNRNGFKVREKGHTMPAIHLQIGKLDIDQKRRLVKGITDVASEVTGVPAAAFYTFIDEYEHDQVAVGGELMSDRTA